MAEEARQLGIELPSAASDDIALPLVSTWGTKKGPPRASSKTLSKTSSRYVGVSSRGSRWRARLGAQHLGCRRTELEAAFFVRSHQLKAEGKDSEAKISLDCVALLSSLPSHTDTAEATCSYDLARIAVSIVRGTGVQQVPACDMAQRFLDHARKVFNLPKSEAAKEDHLKALSRKRQQQKRARRRERIRNVSRRCLSRHQKRVESAMQAVDVRPDSDTDGSSVSDFGAAASEGLAGCKTEDSSRSRWRAARAISYTDAAEWAHQHQVELAAVYVAGLSSKEAQATLHEAKQWCSQEAKRHALRRADAEAAWRLGLSPGAATAAQPLVEATQAPQLPNYKAKLAELEALASEIFADIDVDEAEPTVATVSTQAARPAMRHTTQTRPSASPLGKAARRAQQEEFELLGRIEPGGWLTCRVSPAEESARQQEWVAYKAWVAAGGLQRLEEDAWRRRRGRRSDAGRRKHSRLLQGQKSTG